MAENKASDIIGNLRINYDRGVQAIKRENYDYAIELLSDLLNKDPSNVDVRFNLREAARGKSEKSGGFFKKMMNTAGGGHHLAKAQLALNQDPLEALKEAELMLVSDPKNVTALKISAEAAEKAKFQKTQLKSLLMVHNLAPEDISANSRLADLYCDLDQPEKAEQVYAVLCQHHPGDQDLEMAAKNISARRTMNRGGYEKGEAGATFRKSLKDNEQAKLLEQEQKGYKDEDTLKNLLAEYERRFETESENLKLIKDIAEVYTQLGNYYRALEYYTYLQGIPDSMDSAVEKNIALVTVKRYNQVIEELDPSLEDYEAQKRDLETARDQMVFESVESRVERYPTDMDARFEYGTMLHKRGDFQAAIKELQHVQKFPRLHRKAVLYLAKCFSSVQMTDLAINALQKEVDQNTEMDQDQKELIYTLAGILEESDRGEEAIAHYKSIFEVDISFKDVGDKVSAYYRK